MAYGDYGRTTELEAVNICLGLIGEQPVNSIPAGVSKASLARDLLYEFSREYQSSGLLCNTEENLELTPDTNNNILLPSNCLDVDPSYLSDNKYVERNGKLYDRENHTFTITVPVKVDITYFLTWEELPEHVRRYIGIRAARVFQKRYVSDGDLHRFTQEDEDKAKAICDNKETSNKDFSLLDNTRMNPRTPLGWR